MLRPKELRMRMGTSSITPFCEVLALAVIGIYLFYLGIKVVTSIPNGCSNMRNHFRSEVKQQVIATYCDIVDENAFHLRNLELPAMTNIMAYNGIGTIIATAVARPQQLQTQRCQISD